MFFVRRQAARWLERALLAIGVTCLGYYGYHTVEAENYQQEQKATIERALVADDSLEESTAATAPIDPGAPVALLDIPRLKLSTPVASGDNAEVLDVAVGHLRDTPLPWEPGNSAIAGHRDGLFRPLRHIRVGDEVKVRAPQGEYVYRVRETKVVKPDDLSVLAPSDGHTLTLITCYPFNFVGPAPKRFIVHADRVE